MGLIDWVKNLVAKFWAGLERFVAAEAKHMAEQKAKEKVKEKVSWEKLFFDSKLSWQKKLSDEDLKNAAKQASSASEGMKAVVKSETMEAVAGLISSVLKSVPYPFNLLAAATAGGAANALIDKGLSQVKSFAQGGDFVTNGSQMIMVGDNPSGKERVQVTPLNSDGSATNGSQGSPINISISGNVLTQDFVEGDLADAIREATRKGVAFS